MNFKTTTPPHFYLQKHIPVWVLLLVLLGQTTGFCADPPLPQVATAVTISETVAETYYVSPAGDDANPGTAQLPFKTFAKGVSTAVARKNANVSVKLVLKDGTYRERATIARIGAGTSDDAEAALIIQAENAGKAIVSGSDIWGGWTPEGANWVHNWPHNWGSGPQPGGPALGPVALRREMIFVKNQLYRQVLKLEEMGPGKFYVDETADKAYVQPLEGVNMASDTVEVGIRVSTLSIIGRKNIAVKGLVLQHASTPLGPSNYATLELLQDCKNILIEDVDMIWNNRGGMYTHNIIKGHENVTLRRVRMNHNGHQGMQFQKTRNILAEDCETSYNSWRHYWANTISGWYQGGFKFMNTRTSTFIRHKAVENYGTGMWWDIDNKDITARDCYMDGNYCRGMFIEYNQGPSLVKNCTIINTKKSPIIADRNQGGLNFSCTKDVTVEGCTIKNNILGQLHVWYGARRGDGRDYETGQTIGAWDVANFKFRDNVIECGNDPTQTIVDLPNWSYLLNSWDSDSATYRHSSRFNAFFIYQNASYTFQGWQQLINGDTHSTFNQYAVPTNLTVTSVAKRAASISWTDNADNETGYVIERATGSGMSFTVLDTVAAGVTAYQSFSLQPGTAYAFRVRGLNTGNNSYSNTATVTTLPLGTGLRADYRDKWGGHVSRTDSSIHFNWGEGAPAPGIGTDHFTVAWSGQIDADYPENYTFYTTTDDGVRLWVDGKLLIDNWQENHKGKENQGTIFLQAGQKYDIRMEYYEHAAFAQASLYWSSPSVARQVVPGENLYPAVVEGSIVHEPANKNTANTYSVDVFPNPAAEQVTFRFSENTTAKVEVTLTHAYANQAFKFTNHLRVKDNTLTIPLSTIPDGIYQISFTLNGKQISHKVIIQH